MKAYHHHEDYHRQMTQAILDKLDDTELPVLVKTLDALSNSLPVTVRIRSHKVYGKRCNL